MTVAIVALALAVLALTGGLVAAIVWARNETQARAHAQEDKLLFEKKSNDLEDERDAARAFQIKAETERDAATAAAARARQDARAAREELTSHVREKLVTGSDADVAAEVDRLLGAQVSRLSNLPADAGAAASDDHGPT